MKYRKVKLDEIEVPNGIKSQLMEESADIFLVSRDDDTPVLIFGVYTASVIAMWRLVWMITYPAFRPIDFRGAAKLFAQVRKYTPYLRAIVRNNQPHAIRTVQHLGGVRVSDWNDEEGLFEWRP